MHIAISGASGVIGEAACHRLEMAGHEIYRIVRRPPNRSTDISWSSDTDQIDAAKLERVDAVVHLAGEPITGRWSADKKKRIRESRVRGTKLLSQTLAQLNRKPRILISASAIGYYGNCQDRIVDESSASGDSFLSEVCVAWEQATAAASDAGVRVIMLRFGIVLARDGGALAQMRPVFNACGGGIVGTGRQWWSWVAIDDAVGAIEHLLQHEEAIGPFNVVGPNPVSNRQFTKTLGLVLSRPTLLPVPAFAARLALGQMADETLLSSQRVVPGALQGAGYTFSLPDLEQALRHILKPS